MYNTFMGPLGCPRAIVPPAPQRLPDEHWGHKIFSRMGATAIAIGATRRSGWWRRRNNNENNDDICYIHQLQDWMCFCFSAFINIPQ